MSDVTDTRLKPSLGVGSIIGESFSILFRHFFQVIVIGFVPSLIGLLVSGMLVGFNAALGGEVQFTGVGSIIAFVLSTLVDIVVYTVTTALLVQLAYDAKIGRPIRLFRYLGPALTAVVPLAVLSIVVGILAGFGSVLFIIPGLWIYAVYTVVAPAIVIERAGFGGLGRSASLTKEYRWPIAGAIVLIVICAILIGLVAAMLAGFAGTLGNVILSVLVFAAISTIGTGLFSIIVALIYSRLREIKEGVSVDQIASVFD